MISLHPHAQGLTESHMVNYFCLIYFGKVECIVIIYFRNVILVLEFLWCLLFTPHTHTQYSSLLNCGEVNEGVSLALRQKNRHLKLSVKETAR